MMAQGMDVSVSGQFHIFLCMVLSGAASGMLSDVFTQIRRICGYKRITTDIADIVLWAILAGGLFFINLFVSEGQILWYGISGLLIGAVLYFLTLGRLVRPILYCVFSAFPLPSKI